MKLLTATTIALIAISSPAYAQALGVGQSYSTSSAQTQSLGNVTTFNSTAVQQAPGAYAPGLAAAGIEVCTGSQSAGISGPGFGISFGGTKTEKGCEARLDARTLWSMGHHSAANYRLCTEPEMAMAFAYAGTPCPPEFYTSRQQRAISQALGQPPVGVTNYPVAVYSEPTIPVVAASSGGNALLHGSTRYDADANRFVHYDATTGQWK